MDIKKILQTYSENDLNLHRINKLLIKIIFLSLEIGLEKLKNNNKFKELLFLKTIIIENEGITQERQNLIYELSSIDFFIGNNENIKLFEGFLCKFRSIKKEVKDTTEKETKNKMANIYQSRSETEKYIKTIEKCFKY